MEDIQTMVMKEMIRTSANDLHPFITPLIAATTAGTTSTMVIIMKIEAITVSRQRDIEFHPNQKCQRGALEVVVGGINHLNGNHPLSIIRV